MHIIVARPRGFCAGVERAIRSVERALERYGPPVYVLNHIVHNAHVVEALRARGAIFVGKVSGVPANAPLLFSAHGVSPERWMEATERDLRIIDATCPLVERVHLAARKHAVAGRTVLMIGNAGHDEVIGTVGWAPGKVVIVQNIRDAESVEVPDPEKVAYITQTTLSVDDAERIIAILRRRFPKIKGPKQGDICYATANRQRAVKALAARAQLVLVVGDASSSNSARLAHVAKEQGTKAHLISSAENIEAAWLENVETILVTSGASVPEDHVQGVIAYFESRGPCTVEEVCIAEENMHFKLPEEVREKDPEQ